MLAAELRWPVNALLGSARGKKTDGAVKRCKHSTQYSTLVVTLLHPFHGGSGPYFLHASSAAEVRQMTDEMLGGQRILGNVFYILYNRLTFLSGPSSVNDHCTRTFILVCGFPDSVWRIQHIVFPSQAALSFPSPLTASLLYELWQPCLSSPLLSRLSALFSVAKTL